MGINFLCNLRNPSLTCKKVSSQGNFAQIFFLIGAFRAASGYKFRLSSFWRSYSEECQTKKLISMLEDTALFCKYFIFVISQKRLFFFISIKGHTLPIYTWGLSVSKYIAFFGWFLFQISCTWHYFLLLIQTLNLVGGVHTWSFLYMNSIRFSNFVVLHLEHLYFVCGKFLRFLFQ